ncbi:MAG: hypothetical protein IT432_15000 [Phycisphaerales bacterium]|nr:hypothetical protein [Phycisphaerales bacterium]
MFVPATAVFLVAEYNLSLFQSLIELVILAKWRMIAILATPFVMEMLAKPAGTMVRVLLHMISLSIQIVVFISILFHLPYSIIGLETIVAYTIVVIVSMYASIMDGWRTARARAVQSQ